MLVKVNPEYSEVDPYRSRSQLLVQGELPDRDYRVTLQCQTRGQTFYINPVSPGSDTYELLPLRVPGHGQNTWMYNFKIGQHRVDGKIRPIFFVITLLYFDDEFGGDNQWGLVMGEHKAEMRFKVSSSLRGAWNRYRTSTGTDEVGRYVQALRSVKG